MSVELAQSILLDKFKCEPFHNLYLLNGVQPLTVLNGGTCSDKSQSYLNSAKEAELEAHLHTAWINGQEIHRLIRLEIDNKRYFADVGNGWPSVKLFPATTPVEYECYGMKFRTEVDDDVVTIFHEKRGVEKQQMVIYNEVQSTDFIHEGIANRFSSNIEYPFKNQLRFSMVVGNKFLFIRDTKIEIFDESGYSEVTNVNRNRLAEVVQQYFNFDLSAINNDIKSGTLISV